jgi:hypothetical protein
MKAASVAWALAYSCEVRKPSWTSVELLPARKRLTYAAISSVPGLRCRWFW